MHRLACSCSCLLSSLLIVQRIIIWASSCSAYLENGEGWKRWPSAVSSYCSNLNVQKPVFNKLYTCTDITWNSCGRRVSLKQGRTICLRYPCTMGMARSYLSIYDIVSDDDKERLLHRHGLLLLTSYSSTLWSSHQNLCNGSSRYGRRLFIAHLEAEEGVRGCNNFIQHAIMLLPRTDLIHLRIAQSFIPLCNFQYYRVFQRSWQEFEQ